MTEEPKRILENEQIVFGGDYRVVKMLGRGAFGEVYLAEHLGMNALRALKVLRKGTHGVGSSDYNAGLKRFQLEARLGSELKDKHLIQVYDYRSEGDLLGLVMQYAAGGSLAQKMTVYRAEDRLFPLEEALEVITDAAQGLAAVHERGIVHRDVKPSNILLDGRGSALVSDLGLVQLSEDLTRRFELGSLALAHPGTPAYMSPEQENEMKQLKPSSDIYSLGLVLFEMLAEVNYRMLPPGTRLSSRRKGIPAWLDDLLLRMLAEEAAERPFNGEALVKLLRAGNSARAQPVRVEPANQEMSGLRRKLQEAIRAGEWTQAKTAAQDLLLVLPGDADAQAGLQLAEEELSSLEAEQARKAQAEAEHLRKEKEARLEKLKKDAAAALAAWEIETAKKLALGWLAEEPASGQAQDFRKKVFQAEKEKPRWEAEQRSKREAEERERIAAEEKKRQDEGEKRCLEAEEEKKREAEQRAKREAEERVRKAAEERKRLEAVDRQRRETEDLNQRQEAEENARQEAARRQWRSLMTLAGGIVAVAIFGWLITLISRGMLFVPSRLALQAPIEAAEPPACTEISQTWVSPVDGMTLVCVPEGEFSMGSENGDGDVKPVHQVTLDAFWIDQTEVTNAMYKQCVDAGICRPPQSSESNTRSSYYGNSQYADFPVIYVNWDDAVSYCQWAGRELPTEAEWEKAARGTDGRTYPWGEAWPRCDLANYDYECIGDTSAVGSFEKVNAPYGAYDMAGNVWEWVCDWYESVYYSSSPESNPTGPSTGRNRVLRGGSWGSNNISLRAAARYYSNPTTRDYVIGFRCAVSPGK